MHVSVHFMDDWYANSHKTERICDRLHSYLARFIWIFNGNGQQRDGGFCIGFCQLMAETNLEID